MKNSNKKWLSIVLAMWLVLVMSFMVLFILEYIIPFSRNIKWIENSTNSFYQAENWIEESLLFLKTRTDITAETWAIIWTSVKYKFTTSSSWTTTPVSWEWNSWFDKSFDTVSQWNPIQLQVWYNKVNLANTIFTFRIPDLDWNWNFTEIMTWASLVSPNPLPIINWQLSSNDKTLNASWSYITSYDINNSLKNWVKIFDWNNNNLNWINYIVWRNLDDTTQNIWDFYTNNCWASSWCILKMSIINKLELNSNNTPIPYLEYKIVFSGQNALRFTTINSDWNSYSFSKNLKVRIPQQTTNEAFDFTVFQ